MHTFYSVKTILAKPMTYGMFAEYMNMAPKPKRSNFKGYLVEFTDGGKRNHANHLGHISWVPKTSFEQFYSNDNVSFACALLALQGGKRIRRVGWKNDLFLEKTSHLIMIDHNLDDIPDDEEWEPLSEDLLARDWLIKVETNV